MSLIKYRAFLHVVEQGSLTKAAKLLGYSQPGISKMIESLEDELNISLFIRNGSSIELTDNGKQVYTYCKEVVKHDDELINAVNAMNGLLTGNIRIGALNSIIQDYVPAIIKAYSSEHPIIQISLNEIPSFEVIEQLAGGTIDIGFTSKFNVKGIEFIPLFHDPCRLIVNKNHPFAVRETISISDLNGCDFIMLPPEGQDLINTVKETEKFAPLVKYYVHSDAAAVSMVAADLGVYIISEMQCKYLPANVVKKEFIEDVFRVMGIGIKSQKKASAALKEMIRIAKLQLDDTQSSPSSVSSL